MLTTEQIGGIIISYRLECGALSTGKFYASKGRFPVFVADTLEDAIEQCINYLNLSE